VRHTKYTVSLICALFCSLAACAPVAEVSFRQPDEVMFDLAMESVRQNRLDVARLTLETLINTYPDSKYASMAKEALQDPAIGNCRDSWAIPSGCRKYAVPETIRPY
jgi:hypothetical protein